MAYFTIFVAVIVIASFTESAARPADTNEANILNNRYKRSEMGEESSSFFKLPTVIKGADEIHINGIISPDAKTFSIKLPSISGGKSCKIAYDFSTQMLNISPTISPEPEKMAYNIPPSQHITFSLQLTARSTTDQSIFYVSFEANEESHTGQFGPVPCEVSSFDDVGYIQIEEGIESITKLSFQFS